MDLVFDLKLGKSVRMRALYIPFLWITQKTYLKEALSCIKYGKGKYQCTADLLFDWFKFDQTSKSLSNST